MRFMGSKDNQTPTHAEGSEPQDATQETVGRSRNTDIALQIAVRAALQQTGASAAAIALIKNGTLVCLARIGDIAPDLGMRLDVNAGITGACVRTAAAMHCEDTESDPRVDSVVCRTLSIRSILVVPVLAKGNVVGVVEVLSAKDHAFGSEHIQWLAKLSEFVCEMSLSSADDARARAPLLSPAETMAQEQPDGVTEPTLDRPATLAHECTVVPSDTGLTAFLSGLPKGSQSSTWDELSEALTSRMKVTDKT